MQVPKTSTTIRLTATVVGTAVLLAALALGLWQVRAVLLLVFAGVLLAVFLDAIAGWLARKTPMPRWLTLTLTLVVLTGGTVAALILVAPEVEAQARSVWHEMPGTLAAARGQLAQYGWGQRVLAQLPDAGDVFSNGRAWAGRGMAAFSGVLGVLANLVIIAFVGLYLAVSPGRYVRGAVRLTPLSFRPEAAATLARMGQQLRLWLLGKLSLMVFVGVATGIGLYFLHIPLLLPLAVLAALLDFVPNIGPIASSVPAILLGLTIGPFHALWVALLYLAVQVVESYVFSPLVQGHNVSLPPAVLIASQVLLGVLLGLPGVLLATPLTVAALVLVRRVYIRDLLERHVPEPDLT